MGVEGDDLKSKVCLNYIELAARTHEALEEGEVEQTIWGQEGTGSIQ